MNQSQLKYARNRAEAIYNEKRAALVKKFTTEGRSLSLQEKVEALSEGRFTVSQPSRNPYNLNWYNYILFSDERPTVRDDEGLTKARNELQTKFNKLMDELVLGDNEEALKLLAEFEKM